MITYDWNIDKCICHNTMYGKNNVVYAVDYILTATNTITQETNSINVRVAIPYDTNNFKEFDNLSSQEIINWIELYLSQEQIEKYKALANGHIEKTSYKKPLM